MEGFQNFNTNNFDPNSLANQTSSVIMAIVVADVSPSMEEDGKADAVNTASTEVFLKELKGCHRKDDIVIKGITFDEEVRHTSGFMRIVDTPDDYLHIQPQGRGTALYDATLQALEAAVQYRTDLEEQGVDVRTIVYIMTDGVDNSSSTSSCSRIKSIIDDLRKKESWSSSFTINVLGVGEDSDFRKACINMSLNPDKCLDTISASAAEIRKHMGVISQSISSSTSQAVVNF